MANFVSQVKLPNNTTYIIRDPNARTLDNNDFDTINVTELNAGDLIVTGVGRFTNGLYGNLIGNADTASSVPWTGVINRPSIGTAAAKNYTTSVTNGSNDLVTSGAVYTAIENLPSPMVFKGTLGTNGTITSLPSASSSNNGFTYIVITDGVYAGQTAKAGDVFVSNGSSWVLIPSGDDIPITTDDITNGSKTVILNCGNATI